jgi:type II secretory pathway component PulF
VSRLTDTERELIALHLAALRRHGWPAAKAMALVAQGMPAGEAQRELEAVSAGLAAAAKPDPNLDPFLALLAQGEAAGPDALAESVRGSQMALAARRAWRQAALIFTGLVAGASGVGFFAVTFVGTSRWSFSDFGSALPGLTQLVIDVTDAVGYGGPLFVLALGVVPWLVPMRWLPAVSKFLAASRLRQFSAAMAAQVPADAAAKLLDRGSPEQLFGSPALGLSDIHRALGAFLLGRDGAALGAKTLADELQAEAVLGARRFATWAPVFGLVALLFLIVPIFIAMYLPIFSIGGAIK